MFASRKNRDSNLALALGSYISFSHPSLLLPSLHSIIEECLKIYHGQKEKAYERAVTEEKGCYARSKTR
jgi:hypothetical protein